jgi:hypothetical protein
VTSRHTFEPTAVHVGGGDLEHIAVEPEDPVCRYQVFSSAADRDDYAGHHGLVRAAKPDDHIGKAAEEFATTVGHRTLEQVGYAAGLSTFRRRRR